MTAPDQGLLPTLNASDSREWDFLLAGTVLCADDARRTAAARLPCLDALRYRPAIDLLTRAGVRLVAAGNELSVEQVRELAASDARDHVDDVGLFSQHMHTATLLFALAELERAVLSARMVDLTSMTALAQDGLACIEAQDDPLGWLDDIAMRVVHDDEVVTKYYSNVLRTAYLSAILARRLGLAPNKASEAFICGLLADAGMVFIHPDILAKQGLTESEFRTIREHPVIGLRLLARYGHFPPRILSGVYGHHRNLDGSGYGGDGEQPNAYARLVNVASAFNAIHWRDRDADSAVRAIEINARNKSPKGDPLQPKCDTRIAVALRRLLASHKRAETAPPEPVTASPSKAYECIVFDNLTHLLFFLEHLSELDVIIREIEPRARRFIDAGRRQDTRLRDFHDLLSHFAMCPRAMGISQETDFEEFFGDSGALRDIEKESLAVYREMRRLRNQLARLSDDLGRRYVDAEFRDVLVRYRAALDLFDKAEALVKHTDQA